MGYQLVVVPAAGRDVAEAYAYYSQQGRGEAFATAVDHRSRSGRSCIRSSTTRFIARCSDASRIRFSSSSSPSAPSYSPSITNTAIHRCDRGRDRRPSTRLGGRCQPRRSTGAPFSMSKLFVALALFAAACVAQSHARPVVAVAPAAGPPGMVEGEEGGGGGGGQQCAAGESCSFDCSQGGCSFSCLEGSTCNIDCSGGGCQTACMPGATCNYDCSAGNCVAAVGQSATLNTDCSGGNCRVNGCGNATCNMDCSGGNCESN